MLDGKAEHEGRKTELPIATRNCLFFSTVSFEFISI